MKKISIPSVNTGTVHNTVEATRFLEAVKQNLDVMTGRVPNSVQIPLLPENATTLQIIRVINALIERLDAG